MTLFATVAAQNATVHPMTQQTRSRESRAAYSRRHWRTRVRYTVVLFAAALPGIVVGASAQSVSSNSLSSSNVFVGYSFIGANFFSGEHANLNGWNVSTEKKYLPYFGIVADISGMYGSKDLPPNGACETGSQMACLVNGSVSEYSFQGGIRGSYAAPAVRPFAEALFGAVHTGESGPGLSNSHTGFSETLGAGLDCRLTRLLGCRIDVDYVVTGTGALIGRQNSIRASTGLVIRF
jgi:hypothetical protein